MQQQSAYHHHRSATVVNPNTSPGPEVYDELDPKDKAQVMRLIPEKEVIFYSGAVQKINKKLISQNRILIVTDKALYNIQPKQDFFASLAFSIIPSTAIKRKIDIKNLFAITLSLKATATSEQFVIHVNGEYDYRYDAGPKCEKIIKSILNAYFKHFQVPFILYLRDEGDLASFHTTDDDLKASIDKRPKEGRIFVTPEIMARGLTWIINNRKALLQQTNMFYSVSPENATTSSIMQGQGQGQSQGQTQIQAQSQYNKIDLVDSQVHPQSQIPAGNPYLAFNNNLSKNNIQRAQSVSQENRPYYNVAPPKAESQFKNVELNFSNSVQEQPSAMMNVNHNQTPSGIYEPVPVPQFDFLQKELVSTNANYNVKITTNFEASLPQGQRMVQ